MSLYQKLQLSPLVLKQHLTHTSSVRERINIYLILSLRSLLLVAFAIFFITVLNYFFGTENSSVAVSLFCILLGIRFVPYGYSSRQNLGVLLTTLILMFSSGYINSLNKPLLFLIANLISLSLILVLTADTPIMGNAGIYVFSYLFITNTPVVGQLQHLRCLELSLGFLICGTVLVYKHWGKHPDNTIQRVFQKFSLKEAKCRWQLRLAIGVSLSLYLGQLYHLQRIVWIGYACMSVLLPYQTQQHRRPVLRVLGVVVGSCLFGLIYKNTPEAWLSLVGPLSGLLLGYATTYFNTTVLNCFGGLLLATTYYGIDQSIIFRIQNNFLGAIFAALFILICEYTYKLRSAEKS